jgi:hypothetical protein
LLTQLLLDTFQFIQTHTQTDANQQEKSKINKKKTKAAHKQSNSSSTIQATHPLLPLYHHRLQALLTVFEHIFHSDCSHQSSLFSHPVGPYTNFAFLLFAIFQHFSTVLHSIQSIDVQLNESQSTYVLSLSCVLRVILNMTNRKKNGIQACMNRNETQVNQRPQRSDLLTFHIFSTYQHFD